MNQWRKPTDAERAQGFVAMLPRSYYCQVDNHLLTIDFHGHCKENGVKYPQNEAWQGYTQTMLERRAKYKTGEMPDWFVEPFHDLEAEWLDYMAGNEPSAAVLKKLETLGSYEAA